MRDDDEEQGGDVNSEDGAQQPPDEELIRLFEKNSRPAKRCLLLFSPKVCPGYLYEKTKCPVFSENLPKTTSTAMLPPESRLILVCL